MGGEFAKALQSAGLSPEHLYIHAAVAAVVWVAVFGVVALSEADGERSKGARPTRAGALSDMMRRFGRYGRVLLLGAFADLIAVAFPFYTLPYVEMFIGLCVVVVEWRRMMARAAARKDSSADIPKAVAQVVEAAEKAGVGDAVRDEAQKIVGVIGDSVAAGVAQGADGGAAQ